MKVLFFVDTHASKTAMNVLRNKSEEVDFLICAGDITHFGDDLKSILEEFDSFGKPIYIIHGNHEQAKIMEILCSSTKNIKFIHKRVVVHKNIKIAGYGGDGFSKYDPEFVEAFKDEEFDILVTHGPPEDALDATHVGRSGNIDYRKLIELKKPKIVICGHLHYHAGKSKALKETLVINPGPLGIIMNLG